MQKLSGFVDVSGNFVAKKMLQGLRKTTAEAEYRWPITRSILKSLIRSFEAVDNSLGLTVFDIFSLQCVLTFPYLTQMHKEFDNDLVRTVQTVIGCCSLVYSHELFLQCGERHKKLLNTWLSLKLRKYEKHHVIIL
jgi:hypothetical protein